MSLDSWIGGLFGSGSAGLDSAQIAGNSAAMEAWANEPLQVSGNAGGFVDSGTWDLPKDSWWDRGGDKKVAEALKSLEGAGSKLAASNAQQQLPGFISAKSQSYPSRGSAQIDALVQLLQKRREALLTAAQGGQGSGKPVQQPISMGLLGF